MALCGICIETLETPVVIPCGHIFCEQCLASHIQSGDDAIHSQCPSCRTTFNFTFPNKLAIPQKHHEYIHPSIRKVFLDISSHSSLKDMVKLLEERTETLESDSLHLIAKCKRHVTMLGILIEGEKEAKREAEGAKKQTADARIEVEIARAAAVKARADAALLKVNLDEITVKYQHLKDSQEDFKFRTPQKPKAETSYQPTLNLHSASTSRSPSQSTFYTLRNTSSSIFGTKPEILHGSNSFNASNHDPAISTHSGDQDLTVSRRRRRSNSPVKANLPEGRLQESIKLEDYASETSSQQKSKHRKRS